ncbi:MerR family transcriptional regulator [Actinocatenispora thailandica]|uniref:MerR family transcriptional regulator n=1 Tax=Actinocatenispora thailandica TaxID=227318 RepID=A0A7R7HWC8_9ACTN|nr:MerR family transcriptional regulator [Actinocatenispora thailandica]BCJ34611.1 MerR family transcriptional regulator [Actinocatenispora thailandica]
MLTIGDFARHGRVSVRMLRHYDALGLLTPARVDAASGYRYYTADQLARLNRIVALKDLGLSLAQIREVLDDRLTAEQLRGMLRLRHAQLRQQIEADTARLAGVEARLAVIEREGRLPTGEIVVKDLPAARLAQLAGVAASWDPSDITPVIVPLYQRLGTLLDRHDVRPVAPDIAWYTEDPDGGVRVHAGVQVTVAPDPAYPFEVVDLPAVPAAATLLHRGPMAESDPSFQALGRWIGDNGYRPTGYRESYLSCPGPDQADWVTELQEPVEPA